MSGSVRSSIVVELFVKLVAIAIYTRGVSGMQIECTVEIYKQKVKIEKENK